MNTFKPHLLVKISFIVGSALMACQAIGMEDMAMPAASASAAKAITGKGTVIAVNKHAGKVTLHHEPIGAISWPAMTMDFKASNPAKLEAIKPGDKVTFTLVKESNEYKIDRIKTQP